MKKAPCSLGWTDHSFRRLMYRIKNNIPEQPKRRRKKRFISKINEVWSYESATDLPF